MGRWFGYMQCSPCGYVTQDRRARTCCKGYCQDASGESCNAWPCPSCGALHAWTGSVSDDRAHDDQNRGLRKVLGDALAAASDAI